VREVDGRLRQRQQPIGRSLLPRFVDGHWIKPQLEDAEAPRSLGLRGRITGDKNAEVQFGQCGRRR
jgi:hypothetical protein